MDHDAQNIVAVNVGSTNTRFAICEGVLPGDVRVFPNTDIAAVAEDIADLLDDSGSTQVDTIVVATVNEPVAAALIDAVRGQCSVPIARIGQGIPLLEPRVEGLDERTGQDRLLNAFAAFHLFKQACAVIDVGTAVTVDFVDGVGVFQGGVIIPGARIWLKALHEGTASLPMVEPNAPIPDIFATNTEDAIRAGLIYGMRGAVRMIVERFAEAYDAYPAVVATGGDAELLFAGDELIERIVPDLTLRGIALCSQAAVERADFDEPED